MQELFKVISSYSNLLIGWLQALHAYVDPFVFSDRLESTW